jgi:ceramide glucosyltransferase
MPRDYIGGYSQAGAVTQVVVRSPSLHGSGFWAEFRAFLNTYQARWQYAADTIGLGFAQGKTMLWRRADLQRAGGIRALGAEIAEDAAATKMVRSSGRRVRLVDRAFGQPLGRRSASQVWSRQVRWAKLRRATFPVFFLQIQSSRRSWRSLSAQTADSVGRGHRVPPCFRCARPVLPVWRAGTSGRGRCSPGSCAI